MEGAGVFNTGKGFGGAVDQYTARYAGSVLKQQERER